MTFDKIKNLLADQLGISADDIKPGSRFVEDLGADSLDTVELLMALEDEFGITIDETKVQNISTVQDIVNLIDEQA